ncbi:hypothetical protein GGI21_003830 [Coemansia aciculifera]|nr:hypothetical protein GGI21_003830 [Coemansia aciculifera]
MSPWLALSALLSVSAVYRYIWDMTLGRLERHWETLVPPERPILSFEDFVVGHGMANIRVGFAVGNRDLPPDPPAVVHGNGQQPPLAGAQVGHDLPAGALVNSVLLGRLLAESLLLPAISSAFGSLIARLPFVRRNISHFSKVVLGGCAYFVIKDLIGIFYKYLLFRSRSTRYLKGRKRL